MCPASNFRLALTIPGQRMGETDIAFRKLLRELPAPILKVAFPHRSFEVVGPLDASTDRPRQLTTDNLFRVRESGRKAILHVEIE